MQNRAVNFSICLHFIVVIVMMLDGRINLVLLTTNLWRDSIEFSYHLVLLVICILKQLSVGRW